MKTITKESEINLPEIPCPICKEGVVVIEEVGGWVRAEDGGWEIDHLSLSCSTEPDIQDDEWEEWEEWHFRTPYADWLPLSMAIKEALNKRYRWNIDG